MNDDVISLQIGEVEQTNQDNFLYHCVWFKHEDGTVSQHLFTPTELRRSAVRASNNPSLCFPLRVEHDEDTQEEGQEALSS